MSDDQPRRVSDRPNDRRRLDRQGHLGMRHHRERPRPPSGTLPRGQGEQRMDVQIMPDLFETEREFGCQRIEARELGRLDRAEVQRLAECIGRPEAPLGANQFRIPGEGLRALGMLAAGILPAARASGVPGAGSDDGAAGSGAGSPAGWRRAREAWGRRSRSGGGRCWRMRWPQSLE